MMRRSLALYALAGVAVAACDVPTEPPAWEQTWVVPGETIDLSVAELLPAGVTVNTDTSVFVAAVLPTSMTLSLADMCGTDCSLYDGFVVPKPEFSDTITSTTSLPAGLVSASLTGGAFDITLAHNLSFDPLRPSSDPSQPRGHIAIAITSDGNVVADTVISGVEQAFPADTILHPILPVRDAAASNALDIEIRIYSPEGDSTRIESSDTLGFTLSPSTLEASEATVEVGSLTIDRTTTIDFSGLEQDGLIVDRIQRGALLVDVANPFSVTGALDLEFQLPGGTIQRSLAVQEGSYSSRIDFTREELRQILGSDGVTVLTSGSVSATDGTVTVTPRQELILNNDFEVVLLVGGSEEEE